MTITFENDNDIIVYPLERIISYARDNQYIFLVQSIWWISSIIGLQQGLIIHIDNLRNHSDNTTRRVSREPHDIQHQSSEQDRDSVIAGTDTKEPQPDRRDRILRECYGGNNTLTIYFLIRICIQRAYGRRSYSLVRFRITVARIS
jgi:hypothetical protein